MVAVVEKPFTKTIALGTNMPRNYIPVTVNGPRKRQAILAIQELVYFLVECKRRKSLDIPIKEMEFRKGIQIYVKLQVEQNKIKPNTDKAENLFRQIQSFDMDFAKQVKSMLLY